MSIDGVNSGGKIFNFIIDQNNDKYLYVSNQIEIPGASFQDMLGAKLIYESGQNVYTCKVSDDVPGYQKNGIINLLA